jgi:hypothetical protein
MGSKTGKRVKQTSRKRSKKRKKKSRKRSTCLLWSPVLCSQTFSIHQICNQRNCCAVQPGQLSAAEDCETTQAALMPMSYA